MDTFDTFIDRVLSNEGGYVNNPKDPGGETKFGIAKRSYPSLNISALTRADAIAIYRRDFWDAISGDKLPKQFAFQALDAAVNHGTQTAIRWTQQAAGVAADGVFGPVSLAAVKKADPADLVLNFLAIRLDFYTRLARWPVFGAGWVRRVAENLRYAATDN